jgi:hypothetical protein
MTPIDLICTRCGQHSTSDQPHTCPPLHNERAALSHLREALKHMTLSSLTGATRELSIAATECEAAILWLERDYHLKLSNDQGTCPTCARSTVFSLAQLDEALAHREPE